MTANKISPQTRSPTRTRLTLAFVVVLGVCVVLAAFVGVSWRWIHRDLQAITEIELPRIDAAMEMEINTLGTGLAVTQYLHDHQDEHLQRIDKDRMDFEQALATYRRLAPPGSVESELADHVQQLYRRFHEVGDDLIATDRRILSELETVGDRLRVIDNLLDEKLQPAAVAEGSAGYVKLRLLMDLEIDVNEMSRRFNAYLTTADEAVLSESLAGDEQEFRQDLTALQSMPLSEQEQEWAQELERLFEEVVAAHQAIHQDKQLLDRGVEEFGRLRIALDDLLDDVIQQRAVQDIQTASTAAERRMRAFTLTAAGLTAAALLLLVPVLTLTRQVAKTERELRESERRVRSVLDGLFEAPIGLCFLDRELRYVFINEWLAELNGTSVEGHLGRTIREVLPEVAAEAESQLRHVLETGEPVIDGTVEAETPANPGQRRVFQHNYYPVVGDDGTVLGVSCAVQDFTDRKRAEEALRLAHEELEDRVRERTEELLAANKSVQASEERFALALEATSEGVWDWNIATGEIFCSPPWCKALGFDPSEVEPHIRFWNRLTHPEDMPRVTEALNAHFQQKTELYECEVRLRTKSGEYRWILDRGKVVARDQDGKPLRMVGVDVDITERKRAEEVLRQSEERLISALVASKTGTWRVDLRTGADTRDASLNQMLGLPAKPSTQPVEDWFTYVHPDDADAMDLAWQRGLESGLYSVEHRLVRRDGQVLWVYDRGEIIRDDEGQLDHAIGAVMDITERKQAEIARRASEERFRVVFEAAPSGMAIADADGNGLRYNSAMQNMLGYSEEELRSMDISQFTHADDVAEGRRLLAELCEGKRDHYQVEKRYIRKDGTVVWGILGFSSVRDDQGEVQYLIASVKDITERKRAEEQARQLQADLAHMSRLSSMGEMATGLAHELNQPLTVITNYAQGCVRRLKSNAIGPEELGEILGRIATQAQRSSSIIRGLGNLVRKSSAMRFEIDINHCIMEVADLANAEAVQHRAKARFELEPNLPPVMADQTQLQQVILNLVQNGCEATQDTPESRRAVTVQTKQRGDRELEISVSDNGRGISEPLGERLFEPFFTTKAQGIGMGLAISRSIVESHGGRLWATPNRGEGTTFHFTLPIVGGHGGDE